MDQSLKKLKNIGAQKIHEDTHIVLAYVQSVIHESFEGLTKIQFLGFISVLEREYKLDLSALKKKGLEYFEEEEALNRKVFVVPEKKAKFTSLYIIIVIMIFSLAIYKSFDFTQISQKAEVLDNHVIVDAQKNIANKIKIDVFDNNKIDENLSNTISENNTSIIIETNISDELKKEDVGIDKKEPEKVVEKKEPVVVQAITLSKVKVVKKLSPLIIKPRERVWIGWIDRVNHKKTQAVVKKILTLDGAKEWLIATGHGNINIILNGKKTTYSSPKSLHYLYKDGILKKLSIKEFKKLNNGHLW